MKMGLHFDNFNIEGMSREGHQKKQTYVLSKCKCRECPSYVEGDKETAYCFPLFETGSFIKKNPAVSVKKALYMRSSSLITCTTARGVQSSARHIRLKSVLVPDKF